MVKGKAGPVSGGKENLKPSTPRLATYNAVANLKATYLKNHLRETQHIQQMS